MDGFASLQDVANLVVFVAPGYFAIRAYALVYAKDEKDFSRLLIESIVCSLPIVGLYNFIWRSFTDSDPTSVLSVDYLLWLLALSIVIGLVLAYIRSRGLVKRFARALHLPGPDEDFIRLQFGKLRKSETVTVTLKSGAVFSGTPQGGNAYRRGEQRQYYFNNVAWYDKDKNTWENRSGSVIIDLGEIEYMETVYTLPAD